jgi:hypothetical protein
MEHGFMEALAMVRVSRHRIAGHHPVFQPMALRSWIAGLLAVALILQSILPPCTMSIPALALSPAAPGTTVGVKAEHGLHADRATFQDEHIHPIEAGAPHYPPSGRDLAFGTPHPDMKRFYPVPPCPAPLCPTSAAGLCCAAISAVPGTDMALATAIAIVMKPGEQQAYSSPILTLEPPPPRV